MRLIGIALALFFASGIECSGQEHMKVFIACTTVVTPDGSIEAKYISQDSRCIGRTLYEVTDRYIGFTCRTWGLYPISCKMIEPEPELWRDIKPCPARITPDGLMVFQWSAWRNGSNAFDQCEEMHSAFIRIYDAVAGQVCIMSAVSCISIEALSALGKERVQKIFEQAKETVRPHRISQ